MGAFFKKKSITARAESFNFTLQMKILHTGIWNCVPTSIFIIILANDLQSKLHNVINNTLSFWPAVPSNCKLCMKNVLKKSSRIWPRLRHVLISWHLHKFAFTGVWPQCTAKPSIAKCWWKLYTEYVSWLWSMYFCIYLQHQSGCMNCTH